MTNPIPPAALLAIVSVVHAQGLTPIQVMKLRFATSVIDAGENGVLFTRVEPRLAKDGIGGARRYLYHLPAGTDAKESLFLTGGGSFAVWGNLLTFAGKVAGAKHNEVMAKSLVDGKVSRITKTPNGVRAFHWSPNFEYVAYTQLDSASAAQVKASAAGFKQRVHDEDYRNISLWLWERKSGKVTRLTRSGSVAAFEWSADSSQLALALAPRNLVDDGYMFKRIHVVTLGGKLRKLIDNPGKLGKMSWSPDGKTIAYLSAADKRDPHNGMLYAVDVATGKARALTKGFRGSVNYIQWSNGGLIQAIVSKGVRTYLATVDPTTASMAILHGGEGVAFTAVSWGKNQTYVVGSTAKHPAEVYAIAADSKEVRRLTNSNPWLDQAELGKQQTVTFKARDDLEIEGLLIYPVGYKAGTRYPMVIVVHGGPESHFSDGWNTSYSHWGQLLSARGYFAWYPNYRSSTGYGVEFTKHDHGDLMGGEFNDHIDAIGHFAEQGLIDPKRVGMGGGSYGGYTTAWAATKGTSHIAAAVSFVPFVDIRTKWYTSDISWEFYFVHYEEKHAHQQVEYLASRSPLTFASMCRTPLLLLGGTSDPRVHPSQPHMLYRAVKMTTKTPVRYVQYPKEGHGNRTNTNQFDYAIRSLRWFDHYLRPGNQRSATPPPYEVDYSPWYATNK
ncbi:MAG: prolyl oligopeptidase family serine peptidase [Planctomycetota bacterium]|nr:prolyl oligopeptidase family serine peptidase [Planctomycetota bacterium]